MALNELRDLYVHELRDLYNAEKQITKALPKMIKAANHDELRSAFEEHLEVTREQMSRLEQIFERVDCTGRPRVRRLRDLLQERAQWRDVGDAEPFIVPEGDLGLGLVDDAVDRDAQRHQQCCRDDRELHGQAHGLHEPQPGREQGFEWRFRVQHGRTSSRASSAAARIS